MNANRVYLDQNVISRIANGDMPLLCIPAVQWIYSKEHFREISRSDDPMKYLRVLDRLDAKLIDPVLSDWEITGEAHLHQDGTAEKHYADFLDAIDAVGFSDGPFDAILAWVNGGGDEALLHLVPEQAVAQIQALNDTLPLEMRPAMRETFQQELAEMVDQMATNGNDIKKMRELLGEEKGSFGSISGKNELLQIWSKISQTYPPGISCDQFFGFVKLECLGGEVVPMLTGIISCCAVLDIIGFQAEPKCRKIEKLPNVRSDATHIAMGAFCSAIITADRRFARRAKAIYEYKTIATVTLLVQQDSTGESPSHGIG